MMGSSSLVVLLVSVSSLLLLLLSCSAAPLLSNQHIKGLKVKSNYETLSNSSKKLRPSDLHTEYARISILRDKRKPITEVEASFNVWHCKVNPGYVSRAKITLTLPKNQFLEAGWQITGGHSQTIFFVAAKTRKWGYSTCTQPVCHDFVTNDHSKIQPGHALRASDDKTAREVNVKIAEGKTQWLLYAALGDANEKLKIVGHWPKSLFTGESTPTEAHFGGEITGRGPLPSGGNEMGSGRKPVKDAFGGWKEGEFYKTAWFRFIGINNKFPQTQKIEAQLSKGKCYGLELRPRNLHNPDIFFYYGGGDGC